MEKTLILLGVILLVFIGYRNQYTKITIDLKCEDNKVQIYLYEANVSDKNIYIKKPEYLTSSQIFKDDNGNYMKCSN